MTKQIKHSELDKQRVRGLIIKGFGKEEIHKITKLDDDLIDQVISDMSSGEGDLSKNSIDLYSELQKDLAKLVMLESGTSKDGGKRDAGTILNAIKLQAELQEKKIQLQAMGNRNGKTLSLEKISKGYISDRDKEILDHRRLGLGFDELAKKFGMSKSSINQAIDRASLELPQDLQQEEISPSLISETRGLDKDTRIKIIRDALAQGLDRMQIRNMVNKIKNETR